MLQPRPQARSRLCRCPDRAGPGRDAGRRRRVGTQTVRDGDRDRPASHRRRISRSAACSRSWAGPTRPWRSTSGPSSVSPTTPRPAAASQPSSSRKNQPEQALSRLDRVLEMAADDGEARFLRGRAQLALGHTAQAIADLKDAIRRLPGRADIYYHLALALEADHKPAEALRAAQQAMRLAPDFVACAEAFEPPRLAMAPIGNVPGRAAKNPCPLAVADHGTHPPIRPGSTDTDGSHASRSVISRRRHQAELGNGDFIAWP